MNRFPIAAIALACVFATLTGCHSYETRSYDISVHNATPSPVTIWLTKNGPPYEDGWWSPEDLAMLSPKQNAAHEVGGVIVEPGKTAGATNRRGRFEPETNAVLRVYRTGGGFNELLAISRDDSARTDVTLHPGRNELEVDDAGVHRAGESR